MLGAGVRDGQCLYILSRDCILDAFTLSGGAVCASENGVVGGFHERREMLLASF